MTQTPNSSQRETVRSVIKYFRVTSYITGTALLLVMITWGLRRLGGIEVWAFGPNGAFSLEHSGVDGAGLPQQGLNLTITILVVHGWLYVAYLFGDFRLWTLLRWNFRRFLIIAAGGVIPFLSFFTERHFSKVAEADLAKVGN